MPNIDPVRDAGRVSARFQGVRSAPSGTARADSLPDIAERAVATGMERALESGQRVMRPEALDWLRWQRQNAIGNLVDPNSGRASEESLPEIAKRAVQASLDRAQASGQRFLRLDSLDHLGRLRRRGIGNLLDQQG